MIVTFNNSRSLIKPSLPSEDLLSRIRQDAMQRLWASRFLPRWCLCVPCLANGPKNHIGHYLLSPYPWRINVLHELYPRIHSFTVSPMMFQVICAQGCLAQNRIRVDRSALQSALDAHWIFGI